MTKLNPLEKDVKKDVKKLLDKYKWFWWANAAGGFGNVAGISDIGALKTGVFLAIETKKSPKEKCTPRQIGYLESVASEDGFAFVVDCDNISYLDLFLGAFTRAALEASKEKDVAPEDGSAMLNAIYVLTRGWSEPNGRDPSVPTH